MKYLVTGATGDVGSRVVQQLLRSGNRPRVLVRDKEKAHALFGDSVDVFTGDLGESTSFREAVRGVETVFLVNVGPAIPERDEAAAVLSRELGVKKIVKLSSLDVEHGLAIGAWHEKGEAAIKSVGVPFVFIRPTGFMSNLLWWAHSIKSEHVVRSSTADGHRPFIHSEDIAAVSVEALATDAFLGKAIPITGPESLTFVEATATIAKATGYSLKYVTISDDEARERYARISGSPEETEAHVALWKAIREDRLAAVTQDVERILGRRPIYLSQWVKENADAFRE